MRYIYRRDLGRPHFASLAQRGELHAQVIAHDAVGLTQRAFNQAFRVNRAASLAQLLELAKGLEVFGRGESAHDGEAVVDAADTGWSLYSFQPCSSCQSWRSTACIGTLRAYGSNRTGSTGSGSSGWLGSTLLISVFGRKSSCVIFQSSASSSWTVEM
ncbi:MAG: hypothetical protein EBV92_01990 [Betaproteobacteria bacterium]|nr:hypothetical protein [Betaproteobacteria bacterium]